MALASREVGNAIPGASCVRIGQFAGKPDSLQAIPEPPFFYRRSNCEPYRPFRDGIKMNRIVPYII